MAGKKTESLETRLKELEALVAALESGQMPIDDAIAAYGKGMELVLSCRKSLDEMTQKVTIARQQVQRQLNQDEDLAKTASGEELPF